MLEIESSGTYDCFECLFVTWSSTNYFCRRRFYEVLGALDCDPRKQFVVACGVLIQNLNVAEVIAVRTGHLSRDEKSGVPARFRGACLQTYENLVQS